MYEGYYTSDKRWNLGGYVLKQNPNADSRGMRTVAPPKMNVFGKMYTPKEGYTKSREFSFDIFEKRTTIKSIKDYFTDKQYKSISIDSANSMAYCLGENSDVDIYDYEGNLSNTLTIEKSNYATSSTVTDELNINPMSLIDGDTTTYWRSDEAHPQHTATIQNISTKKISYVEVYLASGRTALITIQIISGNTTNSYTLNVTPDMSGLKSIPIPIQDCQTLKLIVNYQDTYRELVSQIYFGYDPIGTPISMTHLGVGEFAVLYSYDNASMTQEVIIYDENMVENRKYIYSSIPELLKITWNLDQYIYALSVDTTFLELSKNSGAWNHKGNPTNSGHYINASDIFIFRKLNRLFVGVLVDGNIEILEYASLSRIDEAKPLKQIGALVYDDIEKRYFCVNGQSLSEVFLNTSRVDIIALKDLMKAGRITLYDEFGVPFGLVIETMEVERLRNKDESRFIVRMSALVVSENQGFNHS